MKLLRIAEAGRRLGVSKPTIYRAVQEGQIKTVTLSGSKFIPEAEIERILSPIKERSE